ncbi:hypothetical protein G8A07_12035 [Roseateles sp. DAIF2]|uniref:hypothetical protein n=1 Tax=Roseateles sp. DAIF2 TaxID=2714952 RepID=UPI0018A302F0|nr:hypothetical protein [Roseateles sp. DAIF2]QPF73580.1 hypothetical protein G8A07_12035 [Roseateles sp. DAIF2]
MKHKKTSADQIPDGGDVAAVEAKPAPKRRTKKETAEAAVVIEAVPEPVAAKKAPAKTKAPARKPAVVAAEAAVVAQPVAPVAPVEPPAEEPASAPKKKPAARKKVAAAAPVEEVAAEAPPAAKKKAGSKKTKPAEVAAAPVEPAEPPPPPRYSLGSREDEDSVFGDYELHDLELARSYHLRLQGPLAWRCDCEQHRAQADCEHGEALLSLLPLEKVAELDAGWPAREAEVWLVQQGLERKLQWVPGLAVPPALQQLAAPALDEAMRLPAERAHAWLQALLDGARAEALPLRVAPEVWTQLAWARDAQARVARLEPLLAEPGALAGLLKEELPTYQWEAALFAVCAGRALIADDLGLGQRGAAIAAIRLWAQRFGVEPVLLIAPAATHEAWRRDIERLLGEFPRSLILAEKPPAATGRHAQAPRLLVVDALERLDEAALQALRELEVPQLLLIAAQEPLGDLRLAAWVDWLDPARRGPAARLAALPADASKKAQREALQSVLLSRRKRELQGEQLPAALTQPRWLSLPASAAPQPQAPLQQLRALQQRWSQLGFLTAAEQQQLLQALALLPAASRHALTAKVEALLALRQEWLLPEAGAAAARLVVCAQSETLLDSLAQALKVRKLLVQRLRAGDAEAALTAWRAEAGGVLLASDAALAAQAGLGEPRVALIHADLPWSAALPLQRLQRVCGEGARGVPVAQLLIEGSLDRALLGVQQRGIAFPAWLDAPPAWLDEEQLAALMPALQALLEAL